MGDCPQQTQWGSRARSVMRISTKMQVAMAASAAIVFTVIAVIVGVGVTDYARSLASLEAAARLDSLHAHLELESSRLDVLSTRFAASPVVHRATETGVGTAPTSDFERWLDRQTDATIVVWMSADGAILGSSGEAANVAALSKLAMARSGGASGVMAFPSGPVVLSIAPVTDDSTEPPAGTIAIAEPIQTGAILMPDLPVTLVRPGDERTQTDGWEALSAPDGYQSAFVETHDSLFIIQATLTGLDGRPAATVWIEKPDPGLAGGRLWLVVVVPVALGLVTVGLAYLLGMALSRSITEPLHRFLTYLQEEGYLALHGLRTDDALMMEPGVPEDIAELGDVFRDLMNQLRVNQAELLEASDQTLAAERAFRTVVEESPELKILVRDGVVEIANPAAAHFFGLHLGDLLRADPDGLFAGVEFYAESGERIDLLETDTVSGGQTQVLRFLVGDQPERWMEVSIAFIDPDQRDYVISARNITEERRLEALREEVLSLTSHDLRSPLTVVRGYLDILEKPVTDEQREKAVSSARRATERLEGLLNDLRDATRAERVLAPQVMRPVELGELARHIAASLQIGSLQPIVIDATAPLSVLGDSDRIEQAITNLVGNAIKHGPPDGEIRVRVFSRNDRALIAVEDDGPGIALEHRESLFDRGVRGSQDTPGMGLGLYIVRVVSEAHGGSAYIEPMATGTRFVIELPIMTPGATNA
ncbi:MAG: PAS domain-containing sensor histidine kinase [Coriobacteriia bacterium]|nr:PAS domain-containing sensor histidine kinase [Coriobacteriia bacterium]